MTTTHVTPSETIPVNDRSEIPAFATEAEEAAFWATHGFGEALLDEMERSPRDPDLPPPLPANQPHPISIRISPDLLARLKALAKQRNVRYQTLLKQFLEERLTQEEQRSNPA